MRLEQCPSPGGVWLLPVGQGSCGPARLLRGWLARLLLLLLRLLRRLDSLLQLVKWRGIRHGYIRFAVARSRHCRRAGLRWRLLRLLLPAHLAAAAAAAAGAGLQRPLPIGHQWRRGGRGEV